MIWIIVMTNATIVFAFLFGATHDWSALIPRSERLNRTAGAATALTLALMVMLVAQALR